MAYRQLLFPLFILLFAASASTQAYGLHPSGPGAKAAKLQQKMKLAFGGEKSLSEVRYITYTLTRKAYINQDTVVTKQLWYMHFQKPLIVRLDISGTDTTVTSTVFPRAAQLHENANISQDALIRSRFFNFLYMLSSDEAAFVYLRKGVYRNEQVDIIRVLGKTDPALSLDLFVNRKGQVVTSSSINPSTGTYERFGDEFAHEKIAGGLVFPLVYKVTQADQTLVEGIFSDIEVNKLSSFWERQLQ